MSLSNTLNTWALELDDAEKDTSKLLARMTIVARKLQGSAKRGREMNVQNHAQ